MAAAPATFDEGYELSHRYTRERGRVYLDLAPEGGDVFIASRHHPAGLRGGPAVRVLVRFGNHDNSPAGPHVPGTSAAENALEYAIAAAIIHAQGGTFTIDPGDGNETVVMVDIPA